MISILLPTRKRPGGLRTAIESLYSLAKRPDDLELLLRVDDDDPTDYAAYVERRRTVLQGGERWGYKNMHLYYSQLSAMATHPMLLIWNDDMQMLTQDWDEKLLCYGGQLRVQFLKRDILLNGCDSAYPAYPKKVFEILGHSSLNCHVDSWLYEVSAMIGLMTMRDDIVLHHDRLNDDTAREAVYDFVAFQGVEQQGLRLLDADMLAMYLEAHPSERPQ